MKILINIFLILFINACFAFSAFTVAAEKNYDKEQLTKKQQIRSILASNLDADKKQYEIAKIELDKNLYKIYRIAERLIRANNLSDYPWVIEINYNEGYKIDAHTNDGNLIYLNYGIVNTFTDDVSALAFIIGHEMSHQINQHISKRANYQISLDKELEEELQMLEKRKDSHIKPTLLRQIIFLGTPIPANEEYKREIQKIKEKRRQIEEDKLALSRKHEYEADTQGLLFSAKAGFDPNASKKVFEFFKRISSDASIEDNATSHPTSINRIWNAENEIENFDIEKLKKEGLKNIAASKPLGYEKYFHYKSRHISKKTLIIHSAKGTVQNQSDPFEKMFGK